MTFGLVGCIKTKENQFKPEGQMNSITRVFLYLSAKAQTPENLVMYYDEGINLRVVTFFVHTGLDLVVCIGTEDEAEDALVIDAEFKLFEDNKRNPVVVGAGILSWKGDEHVIFKPALKITRPIPQSLRSKVLNVLQKEFPVVHVG